MAKDNEVAGLGERLRQAREAAGLSQAQAAKLLGLHRPAISEMEAENRKVSAGELRDMAILYHVSLTWLVGDPLDESEEIKLAARKLESLKSDDFKTVMRIIDSFRR